jgi:hypothetical protein
LDNLGISFVEPDECGFFPAEVAAERGRVEILQWLWTRGELTLDPAVGWSRVTGDPRILVGAARNGHLEVLEFLVEHVGIPFGQPKDPRGDSCVYAACAHGRDLILKLLIEKGRDLQTCVGQLTPLGQAINAGSFECVRLLIAAGVGPRGFADHAIYQAAACGHGDILRLCLDKWPDLLNEPGGRDFLIYPPTLTPLVITASRDHHADCVRILQSRGATGNWSLATLRDGRSVKGLVAVLGLPSRACLSEILSHDWRGKLWLREAFARLMVGVVLVPCV